MESLEFFQFAVLFAVCAKAAVAYLHTVTHRCPSTKQGPLSTALPLNIQCCLLTVFMSLQRSQMPKSFAESMERTLPLPDGMFTFICAHELLSSNLSTNDLEQWNNMTAQPNEVCHFEHVTCNAPADRVQRQGVGVCKCSVQILPWAF